MYIVHALYLKYNRSICIKSLNCFITLVFRVITLVNMHNHQENRSQYRRWDFFEDTGRTILPLSIYKKVKYLEINLIELME